MGWLQCIWIWLKLVAVYLNGSTLGCQSLGCQKIHSVKILNQNLWHTLCYLWQLMSKRCQKEVKEMSKAFDNLSCQKSCQRNCFFTFKAFILILLFFTFLFFLLFWYFFLLLQTNLAVTLRTFFLILFWCVQIVSLIYI